MILDFRQRPTRRILPALLLWVAIAGCDLTDPGPAPAAIEVDPAALSFDALGAQTLLRPSLYDSDGAEMTGASFTFESMAPEVATVSATGQVMSRSNGSTEIRVRSRGIEKSVAVSVAQTGAVLAVLSGRNQADEIGQPLDPIRLQLTDGRGNLAVGIPIIGEVTEGGGTLAADTVITGSDGLASFVWTLGPVVGPEHELRLFVDPERSSAAVGGEIAVIVRARARPGSPAALELLSAAEVTAHRALPLPDPVEARVLDILEGPIEGATVVVSAPGTPATTLVSGEDGKVSFEWTLTAELEPQSLTLEVQDGLDGHDVRAEVRALPFSAAARVEPLTASAIAQPPGTTIDPIEVRLVDEADLPMDGAEFGFEILSGEGMFDPADPASDASREMDVITDAEGLARSAAIVLPSEPGVTLVHAIARGTDVLFEFTLTAAVPVEQMDIVSGDGQEATEGSILPDPVTVEVRDASGRPVVGVPVHFTPSRGEVEFPVVVSDSAGRASTRWRLGWGAGPEPMDIRSGEVARTVVATALPYSGDDENVHTPDPLDPTRHRIQLVFGSDVPSEARAVLDEAARRWERVVRGDLAPAFLQLPAGSCGNELPLVGTIDDLMIFVEVRELDGPGGIIASAGPCLIRTVGGLPAVGITIFDIDDLDMLVEEGRLFDVAAHEIAHVLGFGTLWNLAGLLRNPVDSADASIDTHFSGVAARLAFDDIGGIAYQGGARVPVENQLGGLGTLNSHWRWNVFGPELMTGFLSEGASPLSAVTVASLEDLGYEVDRSAFDPFSLSFEEMAALRSRDPGVEPYLLHLGDDIHRGPIGIVGPEGEIRYPFDPKDGAPPPTGPNRWEVRNP